MVLAVVNKVVISLHEVFHFTKKCLGVVSSALSPHVLGHGRVVALDSLLQSGDAIVQVRDVFDYAIDFFVMN